VTIEKLKEKVCDLIGLPIQNQRLKFNSEILIDANTIKSYNINKNSIIELIPYFRNSAINIKIKNDDFDLNIDANCDCKIKYLKKFIEFKLNVKINKQVLIFQGQNLDDKLKLNDYKLIDNAFVYLKFKN
jgi:hypothetical protein